MGRLKPARLFGMLLVIFLLIWPIYQIYGMLQPSRTKHDATFLLYQVSLFQLELLSNLLGEAEKAAHTGQLNALRQAAYSVNYTHERLVLAVGEDRLSELSSIPQLLQYIMRLQLGGERQLKTEERDTLTEIRNGYKSIYDDYTKLMAASGTTVIASQNEKVVKIDQELTDMLRKKLLQ
ncbi:hypothetical protein [Paenibacillus sp. J2TS4]|uniref:hypothetical protein n=1 Tax=Paenibacillus sp. J2TS4 TaxID=2807194 RepID=UPI001B2E46F4|nr:hypothetical protein [Paenibacillus sp. J2TS4]GIP31342.1 hypothetical protein J2TS4_05520 [Paenibacillus sp. J2TS4]